MTDTAVLESAIPAIDADARAERLEAAAGAWGARIDADRGASRLTYRVTGEGEGSVATRVTAGRHSFVVDEPAALAGDDVGASPVEFALGAIIACQVVVFRLYSHALGIPFDDIRVTAEGDLDAARLFGRDDTVRPGFSAVRVVVELDGSEPIERYEHLREVVDAHCPVFDLFANATPVTTEVRKR